MRVSVRAGKRSPIDTPLMARCEPWLWCRMWKFTAREIPARSLVSSKGRFWWELPQTLPLARKHMIGGATQARTNAAPRRLR
jgi:hypothetical protein